jgi:hypothetical protein
MTDRSPSAGAARALHAHEVQELAAWERTEGLFDYRLGGIPLWRLIRSRYFGAYLSRAGVRGLDNYNRPQLASLVHFLAGVGRSLLHALRLRRYKHLVIGFARRRLDGGVWVDTFFDPLIDLMGPADTLCIERPFIGRHFRPAHTRHLLYYDWVKALATVAGRFFSWLPGLRVRADASVDALARIVAAKAGVTPKSVRRSLLRAYTEFLVERQCARFVTARVAPRTLLLINRGINHGLIAACRERGVKVYELQHGVMHVNGYKQGTRYDERIDPHGFLTFGECWNRFDWGVPKDAVRVLGYRYIWQQRERQRRSGQPRGDAVMLVSEPGCWQELTRPFSEIVARHPDRQFILKLHPQDVGNWPSRYPAGLAKNVTVADDPSADLYDLFGECRAVVGYGSTVLYEASFFGLKVCLLNEDGTNPSEAVRYVGSYNFYEYARPEDFDRMLESDRTDESMDGNPFFAAFDAAAFRSLLE